MRRIAILSDTHGMLRQQVLTELDEADVILVYGHSHKYASEIIDSVLWLNPGSCGRRRFDLEVTLCRMDVDAGQYRFEKVPIACAPAKRRGESRP